MTDLATTDTATTVDTYLAAYNETDEGARLALVEQAFADGARLIDPPLEGAGRQGVSDMMGTVQQQFPGHRFRRSTVVDEHHGHLRYGWELLAPDGNVALAGMDVGVLDDTGALVRVVGFFEPLAPAAS